jgi:hypothetical protein
VLRFKKEIKFLPQLDLQQLDLQPVLPFKNKQISSTLPKAFAQVAVATGANRQNSAEPSRLNAAKNCRIPTAFFNNLQTQTSL